jgi:hypothetical protein
VPQIVDPLIPMIVTGPAMLKVTLFRLAYLMYRAKRDHIFLSGSVTDVIIAALDGSVYFVDPQEMAAAEHYAQKLMG